jgi:hypothetical protein
MLAEQLVINGLKQKELAGMVGSSLAAGLLRRSVCVHVQKRREARTHGLPYTSLLRLYMTVVLYRQGHCRQSETGI